MIRKITAPFVLAAALLAGAAAPALASVHVPFAVTVNGAAEVTRQPLAVHQVIYCGGIAHIVQTVQGSNGVYTITLTPRLTASATCST